MKIKLLNEKKYHIRFKEITFYQAFKSDNELKVKYSEEVLNFIGSDFEVFSPIKKSNKMKSGMCYANAMKKTNQGYQYVEGVITNKQSGYKISHAWNIEPSGKHIDFTLLDTNDYIYRGVIIPNNLLMEVGFKNGCVWYCNLPYLEISDI